MLTTNVFELGGFGAVVNFKNSRAVTMDEGQGADNGVSVKEYLVETLRPRDEGKALSDICIFFFAFAGMM